MRARSTLSLAAIVGLGACDFRPSGAIGDQLGDDDSGVDARTDGPAAVDAQPIDAAAIDARPPFDPSTCPGDYKSMGNRPTRYRIIDGGVWAAAEATCKAHSAGLTHLAVFTDDSERNDVGTVLFFSGEFRRTWIGVLNDGTTHTVTGEPLYPDLTVGPGQAVTWIRDLITPFRAEAMTTGYAAVCECDGRPSTP